MVSVEILKEIEGLTASLYSGVKDSNIFDALNQHYSKFQSSPVGFVDLFNIFFASEHQLSLFWVVDSLCKIVNSNYQAMDSNSKQMFRACLQKAYSEGWHKYAKFTTIENKLALLFVNWLKFDYPEEWTNIFTDLRSMVFSSISDDEKTIKLDLLVVILNTFDDELLKFRHTFDEFCETKSTLIKDHLRLDPQLVQIVEMLTSIVVNRTTISTKIVVNSLKCIGNLIDWNSLNMFIDIIPLVKELIATNCFVKHALEVLLAFTNKGMILKEKIELLSYLELSKIFEFFFSNPKLIFTTDSLYTLSDMIQVLGIYFVEAIELIRVAETQEEQGLLQTTAECINFFINYSMSIIKLSVKEEAKTATHQIDFLIAVINLVKRFSECFAWFEISLNSILLMTQEVLLIPRYINITQDRPYRTNEDYKAFRKEFLNVYQNLFNIKSFKESMINGIMSRMASIKNGETTDMNEIELALFLISNLDNAGQLESDQQYKVIVVNCLFSIDFTIFNSETILILYLESLIKHLPIYLNNNQMVEMVAKILVGERGICFPQIKIATKVCSIMQKFVEKTRNSLEASTCFLMINSIRAFLESLINTNDLKAMNEFAVIYQAFGILISSPKLNNETLKNECLIGIFNVFFKYFENGVDNDKLNFVSKLLLNFFKSFNSEIKTSKETFFNFFQSFYTNVYKKVKAQFQTKQQAFVPSMLTFINLLQKVIIILAKDSLWFIDNFLSTDFVNPTQEVFENSLRLIISLCSTLKKDCKDVVAKHLSSFFVTIKHLPLPLNNISDSDKSVLSLYSTFIQLIYNISLDFVEIFYEANELKGLGMTEFLIGVCNNIIDPNTKRKSFKCLKAFVTYLSKFNSEEKSFEARSILNTTFLLISTINFNDPTDFNTFVEILGTHQIVMKTNLSFYSLYLEHLLASNQQIIQFFLDNLNKYDPKKVQSTEVTNLKQLILSVKI